MKTISVSALKAHLSAELRKVKAGEQILVLEHRHPVAILQPYAEERVVVREPKGTYEPALMEPLTSVDPATALEHERGERW